MSSLWGPQWGPGTARVEEMEKLLPEQGCRMQEARRALQPQPCFPLPKAVFRCPASAQVPWLCAIFSCLSWCCASRLSRLASSLTGRLTGRGAEHHVGRHACGAHLRAVDPVEAAGCGGCREMVSQG